MSAVILDVVSPVIAGLEILGMLLIAGLIIAAIVVSIVLIVKFSKKKNK